MALQLPRFSYTGPDADLSAIAGYTELSIQQRLFLYAALYGRLNILLTGSAGVGKSYCLDHLHRLGKRLGLRIAFTSTTGVSATGLPNGCTLHSFLQMGLAEGDPRDLARKGANRKEIRDRILDTNILVIDEISMAHARMLDLLDLLGKAVHKNDQLPYGGKLQVILVGDFAQIPPIKKRPQDQRATHGADAQNSDEANAYLQRFEPLDYCFQHPEFSKLVDCTISLEQVFRQSDNAFVGMLNRIRFGRHTSEDLALLKQASMQGQQVDSKSSSNSQSDENVYMYAINRKVDEKNDEEMKELTKTDQHKQVYKCKSKMNKANPFNQGMFNSWLDDQKRNCLAKPLIELVVGAKVMLVVNLDVTAGLCNGSVGLVVDFHKLSRNPIVRFPLEKSKMAPMLLAPNAPNASSSTNVEQLDKFQDVEISPHQYKYEDPAVAANAEDDTKMDGNKKRKRTAYNPKAIAHVIYEQIPLRLAWALSMHKSQGSTLKKLTIDAGNIFENGQFYVALSRAKSLEGVTLLNFYPKCIRANPLVVTFYDKLREQNNNWIQRLSDMVTAEKQAESHAMTVLVREMCKQKQSRLYSG